MYAVLAPSETVDIPFLTTGTPKSIFNVDLKIFGVPSRS